MMFFAMLEGHRRRGFTLIEMLIVIAIIGILASVVLVGLGPIQRQARDSRRISDLRQAQTALELYFRANGAYPVGQPLGWKEVRNALIGTQGITNLPNDPRVNSVYEYGSDGSSYVLGAILEDTQNTALSGDVDGTVFGVDCGSGARLSESPSVYCVQL